MREIKFRAWNAYAKQMYEVDLLHIRNISQQVPPLEGNYMSLVYQPKTVLMQYTGLKDKNGTDVYEGDIIRAHEHAGNPVEWEPGGFSLLIPNIEVNYRLPLSRYTDYIKTWCEVIGNIYENPKLLAPPTTAIGKGE